MTSLTFMRAFFIVAIVSTLVLANAKKLPPETFLNFKEYCAYFQIPFEEHNIQTRDNYILTFFRVQSSGTIKQGLPAVYFQHGLVDSADTFIVNFRDEAPALVLADAGYDVWVGNSRGNKYSRQHTQHSTKDREFWDFTWSEMADYDLPAAFEYIATVTKQPKIDYVGHSQGTLIMFAALSQNNVIIESLLGKFVALAPVVSIRNEGSNLLRTTAGIAKYTETLRKLGIHEILQYTDPTSHIAASTCAVVPPICSYSIKQIADLKPQIDNMEHLPVVMGHFPAGTSIYDMAHFAQMMKYERFGIKRYDRGAKQNLLRYGTEDAPWYELNNIKKEEMYLLYGNYDLLANEKDVLDLIEVLKVNNPNLFAKKYEAGHATFIWGANKDIMKDMLSALRGQI